MTPEQERRNAYLATLDEVQRDRFLYLERTQPTHVAEHLVCADCGSKLVLRIGRYGRFYGCEKYTETGCKGGISAFPDGRPKGWPGNAATRAARKQLVEKFEALSPNFEYDAPEEVLELQRTVRHRMLTFLGKSEPVSIGELTQEECERVIAAWEIAIHPPEGRVGHLLNILFELDDDL